LLVALARVDLVLDSDDQPIRREDVSNDIDAIQLALSNDAIPLRRKTADHRSRCRRRICAVCDPREHCPKQRFRTGVSVGVEKGGEQPRVGDFVTRNTERAKQAQRWDEFTEGDKAWVATETFEGSQ
jgi:hypothetical protein